MGYADVHGKYHKGPKKNRNRRARRMAGNQANDLGLIKTLTTVAAEVGGIAVPNLKPTATIVVTEQPHTSCPPISCPPIGGFVISGAPSRPYSRPSDNGEPISVVPNRVKVAHVKPSSEPAEKVIGHIVRKANGEIVLKFF